MAWEDELVQSSFNDVLFSTENSQVKGGRRIQNFEFPDKEINSTKDHGKKTKSFNINGYVIGDDWIDRRNRLQEELDRSYIGELVHPSKGLILVRCIDYVIDEDMLDNGRMAIFSMSFIEAGKDALIGGSEDFFTSLTKKIADIIDLSKSDFARKFSITGQPQDFIDTIVDGVSRINDAVDNSARFIRDQGVGAASVKRKIETIKSEINELLSSPEKLADALEDAISFSALESKNSKGMDLVYQTSQPDEKEIVYPTENRKKEKSNKNELNSLTRRISLARKSEATCLYTNYSSVKEAYEIRDEILDFIELEIDNVDNHELFSAFSDLRRIVISLIPNESRSIPKMRTVTPLKTMPSLVLVYQEFGSISRNEDFISRNNIENPCFVHGGRSYEVIGNE